MKFFRSSEMPFWNESYFYCSAPETVSLLADASTLTYVIHIQAYSQVHGPLGSKIMWINSDINGFIFGIPFQSKHNIFVIRKNTTQTLPEGRNLTRMAICVTGGEALSVRKHRDVYIPSWNDTVLLNRTDRHETSAGSWLGPGTGLAVVAEGKIPASDPGRPALLHFPRVFLVISTSIAGFLNFNSDER
jgi:hypothetical protein